MPELKFCVKTWMGSILLSGLRDQTLGKNGAQGINNGKKIGINWSRIYHVTTLNFYCNEIKTTLLDKFAVQRQGKFKLTIKN